MSFKIKIMTRSKSYQKHWQCAYMISYIKYQYKKHYQYNQITDLPQTYYFTYKLFLLLYALKYTAPFS